VISFDPKAKLISKDNIAALEACKIKEWLENALEPGEGGINADPELGEGAISADHDKNVVPAPGSQRPLRPKSRLLMERISSAPDVKNLLFANRLSRHPRDRDGLLPCRVGDIVAAGMITFQLFNY
jgi:hypothetical protein